MLTADLVDARKKDGELLLRPLDAAGRAEALALASSLLATARSLVGKRREELDEAFEAATSGLAPKRFKLAAGLQKLVTDACSFEAETELDPAELRRVLFTRASEARRALGEGERFDRARVVTDAAAALGLAADVMERAMFADLKSEHLLRAAPSLDAASLVEAWELGQAQAVLLAAVRVELAIAAASPGLARAFFAKLKFHKLLFTVERLPEAWRVVLDGPYSMFDAVTKYGLRLALALPALRSLEQWELVADIRWGKAREPLRFRLTSEPATPEKPTKAEKPQRPKKAAKPEKQPPGRRSSAQDELHLSDDVRELLEAINALGGPWQARATTAILDVPGEGVCIPDLELLRAAPDRAEVLETVFVEVLGFWSRDAVFRRVELAERGLALGRPGGRASVVFAVSSRLRVSEAVLETSEEVPASLYVYKGKMSPRALIEHAERVSRRTST